MLLRKRGTFEHFMGSGMAVCGFRQKYLQRMQKYLFVYLLVCLLTISQTIGCDNTLQGRNIVLRVRSELGVKNVHSSCCASPQRDNCAKSKHQHPRTGKKGRILNTQSARHQPCSLQPSAAVWLSNVDISQQARVLNFKSYWLLTDFCPTLSNQIDLIIAWEENNAQ